MKTSLVFGTRQPKVLTCFWAFRFVWDRFLIRAGPPPSCNLPWGCLSYFSLDRRQKILVLIRPHARTARVCDLKEFVAFTILLLRIVLSGLDLSCVS